LSKCDKADTVDLLNNFFVQTSMANPKQRHTRHRRDRARKQYDVTLVKTQPCPKCQTPVRTHRICPKCGTYKGKEMITIIPKLKKTKKK